MNATSSNLQVLTFHPWSRVLVEVLVFDDKKSAGTSTSVGGRRPDEWEVPVALYMWRLRRVEVLTRL